MHLCIPNLQASRAHNSMQWQMPETLQYSSQIMQEEQEVCGKKGRGGGVLLGAAGPKRDGHGGEHLPSF